jgi:hypothetical protein
MMDGHPGHVEGQYISGPERGERVQQNEQMKRMLLSLSNKIITTLSTLMRPKEYVPVYA